MLIAIDAHQFRQAKSFHDAVPIFLQDLGVGTLRVVGCFVQAAQFAKRLGIGLHGVGPKPARPDLMGPAVRQFGFQGPSGLHEGQAQARKCPRGSPRLTAAQVFFQHGSLLICGNGLRQICLYGIDAYAGEDVQPQITGAQTRTVQNPFGRPVIGKGLLQTARCCINFVGHQEAEDAINREFTAVRQLAGPFPNQRRRALMG